MSAAGRHRERLAAKSKAEQANFRDVSTPDRPPPARAAPDLLQHVRSIRHVEFALWESLRDRIEAVRTSGDPNALQQEIDRQKAELKAAGLDQPSLSWRLRNACDRLGLNGGRPVTLPWVSKIALGLLLAVYVLLSAVFVYCTATFHNPTPGLWPIYGGAALGIAWILRAPCSRKEGLALVFIAATEMWLNATYHAHAVWPASSVFIAVCLVCGTREDRYVTARIFKNMPAIGVFPRYATEATVFFVPFKSPSARIGYQLTALVALFLGVWVPLFWVNWFWSARRQSGWFWASIWMVMSGRAGGWA